MDWSLREGYVWAEDKASYMKYCFFVNLKGLSHEIDLKNLKKISGILLVFKVLLLRRKFSILKRKLALTARKKLFAL